MGEKKSSFCPEDEVKIRAASLIESTETLLIASDPKMHDFHLEVKK